MKAIGSTARRGALVALAGVLACAPALAGAATPPGWAAPVDDVRLDALRGGFVLPSGLVLSFGIERVATVNGAVVAATRVDIPDPGRITADQARALATAGQGQVVRVGEGVAAMPGAAGALVIQNALDGQRIGAMTTIDVDVGTLGLFQGLNLAATLHDALIGAPTSP